MSVTVPKVGVLLDACNTLNGAHDSISDTRRVWQHSETAVRDALLKEECTLIKEDATETQATLVGVV